MLWYKQVGVAIAQETETILQRIVIDLSPTTLEKCAHQQEQGALWLMEIGDKHLHDLVNISRGYDDSCGRVKRLKAIAIKIVEYRLYRVAHLHWLAIYNHEAASSCGKS